MMSSTATLDRRRHRRHRLDEDHDTQSTWYKRARFQLRVDARSETELGTLRAYWR